MVDEEIKLKVTSNFHGPREAHFTQPNPGSRSNANHQFCCQCKVSISLFQVESRSETYVPTKIAIFAYQTSPDGWACCSSRRNGLVQFRRSHPCFPGSGGKLDMTSERLILASQDPFVTLASRTERMTRVHQARLAEPAERLEKADCGASEASSCCDSRSFPSLAGDLTKVTCRRLSR